MKSELTRLPRPVMMPSRSNNNVSDRSQEPDDAVALRYAVFVAKAPHSSVQGAVTGRRKGDFQRYDAVTWNN